MKIPAHGKSKDQIKAALEAFAGRDLPWREGKTLAYIYDGGPDVEEIGKWAYMRYLTENGLDPTVYPSMMLIENELSAMAAAHLGDVPGVVGNFTSGGTESCMLAVKSARDYARAVKPHVKEPEVILPVTITSRPCSGRTCRNRAWLFQTTPSIAARSSLSVR